jgi:protein SCO1
MISISRTLAFRASVLLAALLLSACTPQQPPFANVDITGADYADGFSLTDASGKRRQLSDFRGKVVAVFFGFVNCPDVCPTTLSQMAEVRAKLGEAGQGLQVVFITVDPQRDTPELLAQYVPGFDRSFIGLTGTPEEIAATAKRFKVFYQKVPGKTPGSYTMDHTAASYVFDRSGRIRLFVRHGLGVEPLVADIQRLLAS